MVRAAPRIARPAAVLTSVAAVLAMLAAGCTVGPSQRTPVAVRGENLAAPAPPAPVPVAPETLPEPEQQSASLPFFECTDETFAVLRTPPPPDRTLRVECAELVVPADPAVPGSGATSLGVVRVGLADAPESRPPLLAVGDSATEPTTRHAVTLAGQVTPALLQSYSLIGLDRRGSGSDGLNCAPVTARAALLDADPAATGEAELSALLERARSVVQDCGVALDGRLAAFRTSTAAADIELLRSELGVGRLSAIGVGDGAAALAGWARDSPQAVGRIVLDAPPDPGIDDPELSESRAEAGEATFDAFAVACSAQPDCPLGPDPRRTMSALVEALRTQPLVTADGRRLTAGGALNAVLTGLGEPRGWPALTGALAAATGGDAGPLLDVLSPVTGPRGRFDGMLATACNDTRRRPSPAEISTLAAEWRVTYPLFGGTFALRLVACAPWPTGGPAPASGSVAGTPTILVLGTVADPRGTLDGSRRAAGNLTSSRFLSWQGAGTGAYPRTACVSGAVDSLLLDGVAPGADILCPP